MLATCLLCWSSSGSRERECCFCLFVCFQTISCIITFLWAKCWRLVMLTELWRMEVHLCRERLLYFKFKIPECFSITLFIPSFLCFSLCGEILVSPLSSYVTWITLLSWESALENCFSWHLWNSQQRMRAVRKVSSGVIWQCYIDWIFFGQPLYIALSLSLASCACSIPQRLRVFLIYYKFYVNLYLILL